MWIIESSHIATSMSWTVILSRRCELSSQQYHRPLEKVDHLLSMCFLYHMRQRCFAYVLMSLSQIIIKCVPFATSLD